MIAAKQRPDISYASSQGNDSEEAQDTMNLKRAGLVLNLNTTVRISEATVMEVEGTCSQSLPTFLVAKASIAIDSSTTNTHLHTYRNLFTHLYCQKQLPE